MRRYREVLCMTDMPTTPDSPSLSLSQIEFRTGNAQSTPANPKEQESRVEPKKKPVEGVLPLMVTTTTVPALIQGQGEMDNSLNRPDKKQIGQLDVISTVRSFLNLNGRAMDEVRYKGTKKDKLTLIVNTPVAHPIEDRHNVVSFSTTSDNTLRSEVSQTKSCQPIPRSTNEKEAENLTGGAIIQDPEHDWDYMGTEILISTSRPPSTSPPRTPSHRRGKGLLGHNLDGETYPNYIDIGRGSFAPTARRNDLPTTTSGRGRGFLSVISRGREQQISFLKRGMPPSLKGGGWKEVETFPPQVEIEPKRVREKKTKWSVW